MPRVEDMISNVSVAQTEELKVTSDKRRKVHFYLDPEDYRRIERLVSELSRSQELLGDNRGLFSKVLRLSVKLGLREIESRLVKGDT
ncbi:MAG: hypothetical protein RMJ06_04565 [Nitrososphaerota archaeon]|nr:hypothetical protein [Nitrososphaerota archaeon]